MVTMATQGALLYHPHHHPHHYHDGGSALLLLLAARRPSASSISSQFGLSTNLVLRHGCPHLTLQTPPISSFLGNAKPTPLLLRPRAGGWRQSLNKQSPVTAMSKQPSPAETDSGEPCTPSPSAPPEQESDTGPPSTSLSVPLAAVVGMGAAVLVGAFVLAPGGPSDWIQWAEEQIAASGDLAPLYFAVVYAVATVLFLPAALLTIAAGYLFGPALGTAVVSLSSTSGAALAFLIARYAARPLVTDYLANYKRFSRMDRAIAEDGRKIVFLWRLSPLFPFALSNYMFGLTGVGFWEYVGASWAGMLPATFAYVYLGGASRATLEALSTGAVAQGGGVDPIKLLLYAVGAVATLVIVSTISKLATKVLQEAEEQPMDEATNK